jgi:site-specific DNA recombinase
MSKPKTTTGLKGALEDLLGFSEGSESQQKVLRYAIYCRKSTDASEKQEWSLIDQMNSCKELAERDNLFVAQEIMEKSSAKYSGIRPRFNKLLDDIRKGKIDGIISWAPDRLARNMKEGGEIIDLLDRSIIKDLKFSSFTFSNDSSGKLLLGVQFVMSKQYSDNLSSNVKRGINSRVGEGRLVSKPKVGYYKDRNGYMRPDEENHALVSQAFKMRIAGKSLDEINRYLMKMGFPVETTYTKGRRLKLTVKRVSEILKDPVYAGVFMFGDNIVDLTEKYDFVPAVSVKGFTLINKIDGFNKDIKLGKHIKPKDSIQADLMRGMVICADCNKPMVAGITVKKYKNGNTTKYFYYRCATKKCPNQGKSVRAKLIIDAAIKFLVDHPLNDEKSYQHYKTEMKKIVAENRKELQNELKIMTRKLEVTERRIIGVKDALQDKANEEFSDTFRTDLKTLLEEKNRLTLARQEISERLNKCQDILKTFSEFVELFEKLPKFIENIDSMSELDFMMRKLFTNFVIKDKKVAEIKQNPPFRGLRRPRIFRDGSPKGIRTPVFAVRGRRPRPG